jgi:hypothetical protein
MSTVRLRFPQLSSGGLRTPALENWMCRMRASDSGNGAGVVSSRSISDLRAFTRTYSIACELPTYQKLAQGKLCALLIFQGRTQLDKIK